MGSIKLKTIAKYKNIHLNSILHTWWYFAIFYTTFKKTIVWWRNHINKDYQRTSIRNTTRLRKFCYRMASRSQRLPEPPNVSGNRQSSMDSLLFSRRWWSAWIWNYYKNQKLQISLLFQTKSKYWRIYNDFWFLIQLRRYFSNNSCSR